MIRHLLSAAAIALPTLAAAQPPIWPPPVIMATSAGDQVVKIPSDGSWAVFAVAAENIGPQQGVIFYANGSNDPLPVAVAVCQTNATTGACLTGFVSPSFYQPLGTGGITTFTVWISEEIVTLPPGRRGTVYVTAEDITGVNLGQVTVAVETE